MKIYSNNTMFSDDATYNSVMQQRMQSAIVQYTDRVFNTQGTLTVNCYLKNLTQITLQFGTKF